MVLKDTCLKLGDSEILGIVGPNGSGKSTLIKCIAKILEPRDGTIALDGTNIKELNLGEISKKIGYVPQNYQHSFAITVFDAILMGRKPHLNFKCCENDYEIVLDLLQMLHIEDFAMRDINELSGGEQQRVSIARALAQETGILLLDEATANLDIRHQLEVMNLLKNIVKNRNVSAIMAIHDLNLAARYADRAVMMKDGEIFATGTPSSVFTSETIRQVYGVESEIYSNQGKLFIMSLDPVSRGVAV
jgi:iron complex transport system ATP-binding protein